MNESWSAAEHLAQIIRQVFGLAVDPLYCDNYLRNILEPSASDHMQTIASVLNNQEMLSDTAIATLVMQQLTLFAAAPEAPFAVPQLQTAPQDIHARWQSYLNKLDFILAEVQRRVAAQYEIQLLMPPQKQMLELQEECLQLTSEYYGLPNMSCFYLHYIRMSEAANITRFAYAKLDKLTAQDKFVSLSNHEQRNAFLHDYEQNVFLAFIKQGGIWAHGRSAIDATAIANVFYYKHARQLMYLYCAKKVVAELLGLEQYGALPQTQREYLWHVIQEQIPADTANDQQSIFYKFAKFCNHMPGACYTDVPHELPQEFSPAIMHAAVKVAGLLSNNLVLISRKLTEDWTPKRYLVMHWQRKYPLENLRTTGSVEHLRIWPNEMPYAPGHGISMCGDGLIEGLDQHGSIAYEWNVPIDVRAEMDNSARDIEKMFREMQLLCPPLTKELLPGEAYLYLFQNIIAYSSQNTQHLHIGCGTLAEFPIYNLPATFSKVLPSMDTTVEIVPVGSNKDAVFVRFYFASLENEALLRYLLDLNEELNKHFNSAQPIDVYIHLLVALPDRYVFILEPHAMLQETADHKFYNPENGTVSVRKPQFLIPRSERVDTFPKDHHLYNGRAALTELFDATCKRGVYEFLQQYFNRQS